MMKFFRKHNRKLLAIFMALLLIVWLGGSALQALFTPDRNKILLATTRLGDIVEADRAHASFTTDLLRTIGINWSTLGRDPRSWRGQPLELFDWILLTREAQAMGVRPSGQELDGAIDAVLKPLLPPNASPDAAIQQVAVRRDIDPAHIRAAIADFVAIHQVQQTVMEASLPSEAEVRVAARDTMEKVKIEAVSLRALLFLDPAREFSDEELQKQFEEYRDAVPAANSLTFGYYQPARVKVEYMMIHQQQIQDNLRIEPAELDRRAKDYWREKRNAPAFKKPPATQPTTAPDSQPAAKPAAEYFETFAEARQAAYDVVRRDQATQAAENLANWLSQQLAEAFFDVKPGQDQFRPAPDSVKAPGYLEDVRSRIPPSLAYPDAVQIAATDWVRKEDTLTLPTIGTAYASLGEGTPVRLDELAFQVQGLVEIPADERPVNRELITAQYQFSPLTLRGMDGNLFLFRVIGVEPAHSPESVDVVRNQVIEDLRMKTAFEQAREKLTVLKDKAVELADLNAAWSQDEALKAKATTPEDGYVGPLDFPRRQYSFGSDTQVIRGLGAVSSEFVKACFAVGERPDEKARIDVLELPNTAKLVLVRCLETIPVTRDQYYKDRESVVRQIAYQRQSQAMALWTDPKQIRERNGFAPAGAKPGKKRDMPTPEPIVDMEGY